MGFARNEGRRQLLRLLVVLLLQNAGVAVYLSLPSDVALRRLNVADLVVLNDVGLLLHVDVVLHHHVGVVHLLQDVEGHHLLGVEVHHPLEDVAHPQKDALQSRQDVAAAVVAVIVRGTSVIVQDQKIAGFEFLIIFFLTFLE